jgi:hypothetical protein
VLRGRHRERGDNLGVPNGHEAAATDASVCSAVASDVSGFTGVSFSETTTNAPGGSLVPACVGTAQGVSVTVESASSTATNDLCHMLGWYPSIP